MLTDFQNSFTSRLSSKFAVKQSLNIPPHINSVAALPGSDYSVKFGHSEIALFLLKMQL